ncbi:MAG: hypothetical protein P8175_01685 [Deltaproteobacteria bacterium]
MRFQHLSPGPDFSALDFTVLDSGGVLVWQEACAGGRVEVRAWDQAEEQDVRAAGAGVSAVVGVEGKKRKRNSRFLNR